MKKKNNNLYKPTDINKLLRLGETSKDDLKNIAKEFGLNIDVVWADNYNINSKTPTIINIGDDNNGTHWVACYKKKYFDSFGMPPDSDIKNWEELDYDTKHIQNIKKGGCGSYCILFLIYCINDNLDEFYKLFN